MTPCSLSRLLSSDLEPWTFLVRKEKSIYHTLNKMNLDFTRKVLVAEAWVPSSATARVSEALRQAAAMSEAQASDGRGRRQWGCFLICLSCAYQ